jgi:transposase
VSLRDVDGKGSDIVSCRTAADHRSKRGKTMPNHSLRSDYNAERMRGEAARLPALQRRYAIAIARLYDGDDIDAVAKASDVQPHTVRRWMHVFNEEGIAGFGNAIIGGTYDLRRDFNAQSVRAQAEKAYSPATKVRLFAIAQMYEGVPTREIARLAGVSEGRLSEWRQTFNTAKMVAQGEVENRQLQANARVGGNYWTADKVAASIQAAWDDEHRRKLEVVKLSVEGKSVEAIVMLTGSTRADVVTWIRVFEAGGPKALLPSDAAKKPARAKNPTVFDSTGGEVGKGELNVRRNAAISNPVPSSQETGAERMDGKKAIPRGQAIDDLSLSEKTDKVVDFFATLLEDAVPNKPSKTRTSTPASQAIEKAREGKAGYGSAGVATTDEIVKRGRGRPRKDGQPNKSTALLMKVVSGIRDTVKRVAKDTPSAGTRKSAKVRVTPVGIPIKYSKGRLRDFLAEAFNEEHANRIKCLITLHSSDFDIIRAARIRGVPGSDIARWRDELNKDGPEALIPRDVLEPYVPRFDRQQLAALRAIKRDRKDSRRKVATALLMLKDKGSYPPYVAALAGVPRIELLSWIRDVNVIIGQHGLNSVRSQPAPVERVERRVGEPLSNLNPFQRHVFGLVLYAQRRGWDAHMANYATRQHLSPKAVESWMATLDKHEAAGLRAQTSGDPVRMPEGLSASQLRKLSVGLDDRTANELRALAYIYDGASVAAAAMACDIPKDDMCELVLDFNMFGLEALGFTDNEPLAIAAGM